MTTMETKSKKWLSFVDTPINGEQIYFLAFIIYFLPAFMIDTTFTESLSWSKLRLISYLALPLIIFKIYLLDHWDWKKLSLISVLLLLGIIAWRKAQYPEIMMVMFFVLGAKGVYFKNIIRWYFYLTLFLMLTIAIISLVGIIPNLIYYSKLRPTRYSLGMAYTTFVASHIIYLALAYCYIKFPRLEWFDYIGIIIVAIITMKLTDTRLDFYEMILLVPVMFITQRGYKGKPLSKIISSFWWMAMPFLSVFTLVAAYFYDSSNHIYHRLNSLSSGRLSLSYTAFNRYPITPFGRRIIEHSFGGAKGSRFANHNLYELSNKYFYIDSSYVRMLLVWGLIVFVLAVIVMSFIALRSTYEHTYILSAIVLLIAVNCMFEPHIIQLIYNPFILALISSHNTFTSGGKNDPKTNNTWN